MNISEFIVTQKVQGKVEDELKTEITNNYCNCNRMDLIDHMQLEF